MSADSGPHSTLYDPPASAQAEQLQLAPEPPHPFSGLGIERCQHVSIRGNQCSQPGSYDGLHGKVLCTQHANEAG